MTDRNETTKVVQLRPSQSPPQQSLDRESLVRMAADLMRREVGLPPEHSTTSPERFASTSLESLRAPKAKKTSALSLTDRASSAKKESRIEALPNRGKPHSDKE